MTRGQMYRLLDWLVPVLVAAVVILALLLASAIDRAVSC